MNIVVNTVTRPLVGGSGVPMNIVVNTVTRLLVGGSGVRIPTGEEIILFSKMSKPNVGPTEPPIQWGPLVVPKVRTAGAWK